ncbi:MAG: type I-A CRISPR-associated protein Cas4/Csa1, partial [Pyrodictiaceae archaeon]
VSDVASPCPTKRDVYLRRVLRIHVDSPVFELGKALHEVFLLPFRHRGSSIEDVLRRFRRMMRGYRNLGAYWNQLEMVFRKALTLSMISEEEQVPVSVEPRIPGGSIGLSDFVRPDLMVGFIPVDTTLASSNHSLERKELALTGYALAIEAWTGHPVDVGIAIGVYMNSDVRFVWRVVRIDDTLRRRFLEARDEVARILDYEEDPGKPPQCPSTCPYRGVCLG